MHGESKTRKFYNHKKYVFSKNKRLNVPKEHYCCNKIIKMNIKTIEYKTKEKMATGES